MNRFRKHIQKKLSAYEPEVNDMSLHQNWKQTEELLTKQNSGRQRLTNFEPDVEEAYIAEKWKAIVPYLPEEKKKRALLYIPPGCLLPAFLLLVPLLFFVTYYFTGLTEKPLITMDKQGGKEQHNHNLQHQKETTLAHTAGTVSFLPTENKPVNQTIEDHQNNSVPKSASYNSVNHAISPQSFNDLSTLQENKLPEHNEGGDSVYFLQPIPCYPDKLTFEPLLKDASNVSDSVPIQKTPRFMVDVTGGMAYAHNMVQYEGSRGISHHAANLCLSAALHYRVHKRVWLSGQVIVSNNRYEYGTSATKNIILSRASFTTASLPSSIDSTITYTSFNQTYRLRSLVNCQAGLGTEIGLLSRNKFSLSADLLLQLSMTRFNYSYSYQPSGDTLTYEKHAFSPPLPDVTADAGPVHKDLNYLKTNLGFYPGLVLGYNFTNRIGVVLKPAMYVDLYEFKPRRITYHQTMFLLTAGIRIKL